MLQVTALIVTPPLDDLSSYAADDVQDFVDSSPGSVVERVERQSGV